MDTHIINLDGSRKKYSTLKLTPEAEKLICLAFSEGASVKQAATLVGITRQTYYNWLKIPEFHAAVQLATKSSRDVSLERYRSARGGYQSVPTSLLLPASPKGKLDNRNRYIYLVRESFRGLIKIGIATDLYARMAAIETSCPQELEMIGYVVTINARVIEKYVHQLFAEKRFKGEWFRLDDEDIKRIMEICKHYD